jgi:signal transduction histidine kinase
LDRIASLNDMVQDLLLFARPKALKLGATPVRELVAETARGLGRDPAMAAVQVDIHRDNPTPRVDREQLRLVFLNLLLNAAQSMKGEGTIDVGVRTLDDVCEVIVTDDGPGLSADVLEKMFEPFFTTKHRGSGLGLPTARRIVEAHGGELTANNRPQGGAALAVRLPIP